jgi:hypothetical protein
LRRFFQKAATFFAQNGISSSKRHRNTKPQLTKAQDADGHRPDEQALPRKRRVSAERPGIAIQLYRRR